MSSHLYWRVPPPQNDQQFGYALKFALAPSIWDHDGSLSGDWHPFSEDDIQFLRGIAAGANRNAELCREVEKLIGLIREFGLVELCLR